MWKVTVTFLGVPSRIRGRRHGKCVQVTLQSIYTHCNGFTTKTTEQSTMVLHKRLWLIAQVTIHLAMWTTRHLWLYICLSWLTWIHSTFTLSISEFQLVGIEIVKCKVPNIRWFALLEVETQNNHQTHVYDFTFFDTGWDSQNFAIEYPVHQKWLTPKWA